MSNRKVRKNKLDESYEFRLAKEDDIKDIMQYICEVWDSNHIFGHDEEFFRYEFCYQNHVNFALAIRKDNGRIDAIHGFYPASNEWGTSHFDIWGAMWSVRKDKDVSPFLGIEIGMRMAILVDARESMGVGICPSTSARIHRARDEHFVGKMNHYYMLNRLSDYKIAHVEERKFPSEPKESIVKMFPITTESALNRMYSFADTEQIPYKDSWYINKRFLCYPYVDYEVFGLGESENDIKAVLVLRKVSVKNRMVIRIVDYLGDIHMLPKIQYLLQKMMDENCEYIDFYCYGFEDKIIEAAGFVKRETDDKNIIPNYFSPFEQRNVEIYFNYTKEHKVRICKADADQDRPNVIER